MGHRAQQHDATSLVCSSQRDGDEIKKGGDAEEDLNVRHSESGADRGVGKRWQGRADCRAEGREVESGGAEVGGDCLWKLVTLNASRSMQCTYQATVVKLDGGGVLEEVPPPEVRLVGSLGVARIEELLRWWC